MGAFFIMSTEKQNLTLPTFICWRNY